MKILIYGFKPFDSYSTNITEEILLELKQKNLDLRHTYSFHVFDVEFDEGMFLKKLDSFKPDIVLGLGQHSRAKKLRIERRAVNWMSSTRAKVGEKGGLKIEKHGPEALSLDMKLTKTNVTTITYDAGRYVCNYSIWVVARWCEKRGASSAFIHVPKKYKIKTALKYLDGLLRNL